MLNRRLLRGRALQYLFAYKQQITADYELSIQAIEEKFSPDLNSPDLQNKQELEGQKKLAVHFFNRLVHHHKLEEADDNHNPVRQFSEHIYRTFQNQVITERKTNLNRLVSDTENLTDYYLLTLIFLSDIFQFYNDLALTETFSLNYPKYKKKENALLAKLSQGKILHTEITRKNLSWNQDKDIVASFVKEQLLSDETLKDYFTLDKNSYESDYEVVLYLIKEKVFKNAQVGDHFEAMDLNWKVDKSSVKDMVLSTIENIRLNDKKEPVMAVITKNWEEDKEFLVRLFTKAMENEEEYEAEIAPKLDNWDIERLSLSDRTILLLGVTEMIHFPSIPVKVSINEYIELTKVFSTPGSKPLVNGVLDTLSADLIKKGKIRKTGRGLIDSK